MKPRQIWCSSLWWLADQWSRYTCCTPLPAMFRLNNTVININDITYILYSQWDMRPTFLHLINSEDWSEGEVSIEGRLNEWLFRQFEFLNNRLECWLSGMVLEQLQNWFIKTCRQWHYIAMTRWQRHSPSYLHSSWQYPQMRGTQQTRPAESHSASSHPLLSWHPVLWRVW